MRRNHIYLQVISSLASHCLLSQICTVMEVWVATHTRGSALKKFPKFVEYKILSCKIYFYYPFSLKIQIHLNNSKIETIKNNEKSTEVC